MTNAEAIEEIKQVKFNLNCQLNGTSRFEEAFEMAIKALEQQTCEDEDVEYQRQIEQLEHDILYEPTFNPEDGSM